MENTALVVAGILIFAIGVIHSWLGEIRLIRPLLSPQNRQGMLAKSVLARRTLRFAWHLTTLAWWGFGAILAGLAIVPPETAGRLALLVIAVTFFVTGMIALIGSRGRHLSWIAFFAVAGLSVLPLL